MQTAEMNSKGKYIPHHIHAKNQDPSNEMQIISITGKQSYHRE
jgi:hypothetical protein